jgi:cytochrome c biogenesis protein CcmG, thiol:disulfide interchange protein DsbE
VTTKANRSRGMPRRTTTVETRPSRSPLIIAAVVVGIVLVAAIVALALAGGGSGGLAEPAQEAVGITGEPLAAFTDAASDPALGQTIPTITGTDLTTEPMIIAPGDGPMAIVLLAHWCAHCQAEVPVLVEYLATTGMPEGVGLVAISTSINEAQPNYPPSAWLEREGWTVPTLVDDANSRALSSLGMGSFPGFVFVDADGRVVSRMTGEIPAATFDQIVRSLAP